MKCFLCQFSGLRKVYDARDKTILECARDGLFFADSKTVESNSLYDEHYYHAYPYSSVFNLNSYYFHAKLKKIIKATDEIKPSILDVGCGWGDFLEVLEAKKIPYLGIDISEEAVRMCKTKHLNCRTERIEDLASRQQNRYTAVTILQTIEHLKNPLPVLKAALKLLKKNGILIVTTPDTDTPLRKVLKSRWSVYNTDSQYVFYNKKNLKSTLGTAGFVNVSVTHDAPRFFSLRYILSRLNITSRTALHLPSFILQFPIPTDPLGDLEAIGFKDG